MTDVEKKVDKMAKDAGFDFAELIGKKGIFNIYVCDFDSDGEHVVGLPVFLLENNGEVKYADDRETSSLMDMI